MVTMIIRVMLGSKPNITRVIRAITRIIRAILGSKLRITRVIRAIRVILARNPNKVTK